MRSIRFYLRTIAFEVEPVLAVVRPRSRATHLTRRPRALRPAPRLTFFLTRRKESQQRKRRRLAAGTTVALISTTATSLQSTTTALRSQEAAAPAARGFKYLQRTTDGAKRLTNDAFPHRSALTAHRSPFCLVPRPSSRAPHPSSLIKPSVSADRQSHNRYRRAGCRPGSGRRR
jgi:hypothetical protein